MSRLSLILVPILTSGLFTKAGFCLGPPPITPIEEFFTLGQSPFIPSDWTLDIDGEVEKPLSLSLNQLKQYPQTDIEATLECDFSSGPPLLVSSAVWTGVKLNYLLEEAALKSTARTITFWAHDGYRRGPFTLSEIMSREDFIVAYNMNGESLPKIQGWPAKIVLPGCVGNQWVRWLDRIEISSSRSQDRLKPWPIHARIIEPEHNAVIDKCSITITGMVNAGDSREITQVEVSTDNGQTWKHAQILNYFKPNVWKHWRYECDVKSSDSYTVFARVTDSEGNAQNEDGLYGWWGYKIDITGSVVLDCLDKERIDLNKDRYVDFIDFSLFADKWLASDISLYGDLIPIEGDGFINTQDLMLFANEWLKCFVSDASNPSPSDGQEDAVLNPVLEWSPQEDAIYCDVYFGTNPGLVAIAAHDSNEFLGSIAENRFVLDRTLVPDTIYYWRIDRVGPKCSKFGDVWSFKTISDNVPN